MRSSKLTQILIALAAIAVLFFALGLRLEHPKTGLGNALGSAQSSLVVVKKISEVKPGDKIVVGAQVGKSPVLGIVASVKNGSIEMHVGNGIARSSQDKVAGKLLIVIPFLGLPLNAIGL